jgi:hypothetical protein
MNREENDSKVVYINNDDDTKEEKKPKIIKEEEYSSDDEEEEVEDYANNDDFSLNADDYLSDGGELSDSESVNTIDILNIDPLYLRLKKFLQSESGESIAETLKKINDQLVSLNANLTTNKR